jgi:hypothetical protein
MRGCNELGALLLDREALEAILSGRHPLVMPALVAGIHVFLFVREDVDGRAKPGHDGVRAGVHALADIPCPARVGLLSPRSLFEAG